MSFEEQFHLALIVVSLLNALDQIDTKKQNDASRKTYSFLEVKLRQSLKKTWTKINMILQGRIQDFETGEGGVNFRNNVREIGVTI